MTKVNYTAWNIDAASFSDKWSDLKKLLFFARYAILAPSGHNTQPWEFKTVSQDLLLYANRERLLPYSGVQANEPYVSLGACLQTFELAAKGFGYNLVITYELRDNLVAKISLGNRTASEPSLLQAIPSRVSNRAFYDKTPLPEKLLGQVTKSSLKNASSFILTDRKDIDFIALETQKATYHTFGDKGFRNELSKWVRNNITRQYDGMPGFVQGIPTPPSLLAKHIIKRVDVSKDQAKKDTARITNSANLIIVTVKDMTPSSLLDGGRLYAQICIRAQQQGVATTGAGTAVIDSSTKSNVAAHFSLKGEPIAIIRLGKTSVRARHTPRWPLTKVTA